MLLVTCWIPVLDLLLVMLSINQERLLPTADIDWITDIFKEFGEVAYVSLPKYKDGRNKGFAFVEFKQPSPAVEAVKVFKKLN